jgi:hypothetical protein
MCKVLDQLALINGNKLTDANHKSIYHGIGEDMQANFAEHKNMIADLEALKDDVAEIKADMKLALGIINSKWLKYAVIGLVIMLMLSGIGLAYFVAPHVINSGNVAEIAGVAR